MAFELDQSYLTASALRFIADLDEREARELHSELTEHPRSTHLSSSISLQPVLV